MMERSPRALVPRFAAYGRPSARDCRVILPFALLVTVVEWQRTIQIVASLLSSPSSLPLATGVIQGFGTDIAGQLGLWSFAVELRPRRGADAVPIYLGSAGKPNSTGHEAAGTLINAISAWPCWLPLSTRRDDCRRRC